MTAALALRVLVVDDEPLARARLQTLLSDCQSPAAVVVAQAANAVEARSHLAHQTVDLVLLDIHMPGVDGLALAQSVRNMPHPPALIFVTAHAEHALHAFELEAVDYLTKPVRLVRLQQALQKVARLAQRSETALAPLVAPAVPEALVIQERNRTERVPLDDVLYFKAELKYVTVRTAQRSYLLDSSLNELEQRYADRFLRIHRNAMVARRAARALEKTHDPEEGDGWAIRLDGLDERLPVSRRQLNAVRDLLST